MPDYDHALFKDLIRAGYTTTEAKAILDKDRHALARTATAYCEWNDASALHAYRTAERDSPRFRGAERYLSLRLSDFTAEQARSQVEGRN